MPYTDLSLLLLSLEGGFQEAAAAAGYRYLQADVSVVIVVTIAFTTCRQKAATCLPAMETVFFFSISEAFAGFSLSSSSGAPAYLHRLVGVPGCTCREPRLLGAVPHLPACLPAPPPTAATCRRLLQIVHEEACCHGCSSELGLLQASIYLPAGGEALPAALLLPAAACLPAACSWKAWKASSGVEGIPELRLPAGWSPSTSDAYLLPSFVSFSCCRRRTCGGRRAGLPRDSVLFLSLPPAAGIPFDRAAAAYKASSFLLGTWKYMGSYIFFFFCVL